MQREILKRLEGISLAEHINTSDPSIVICRKKPEENQARQELPLLDQLRFSILEEIHYDPLIKLVI